jgi:hypothetical protein
VQAEQGSLPWNGGQKLFIDCPDSCGQQADTRATRERLLHFVVRDRLITLAGAL